MKPTPQASCSKSGLYRGDGFSVAMERSGKRGRLACRTSTRQAAKQGAVELSDQSKKKAGHAFARAGPGKRVRSGKLSVLKEADRFSRHFGMFVVRARRIGRYIGTDFIGLHQIVG